MSGIAGTFLDPLGISVGDIDDMSVAAEEQEVSAGTFGSMINLFGTKVAAFAYLLFILLYFPCAAAIAAVYRETNMKWTLFTGFWTTFMAYSVSVLFYQTATFGSHITSSILWIAVILIAFTAVIGIMKMIGKKDLTGLGIAEGAEHEPVKLKVEGYLRNIFKPST